LIESGAGAALFEASQFQRDIGLAGAVLGAQPGREIGFAEFEGASHQGERLARGLLAPFGDRERLGGTAPAEMCGDEFGSA
jgi:hypothetical protein